MAKITVPKELVLTGGAFKDKLGDLVLWNKALATHTNGVAIIDGLEDRTLELLTLQDLKDIVTAGGDIEGVRLWIKLTEAKYNNDLVPIDYPNSQSFDENETRKTWAKWKNDTNYPTVIGTDYYLPTNSCGLCPNLSVLFSANLTFVKIETLRELLPKENEL